MRNSGFPALISCLKLEHMSATALATSGNVFLMFSVEKAGAQPLRTVLQYSSSEVEKKLGMLSGLAIKLRAL